MVALRVAFTPPIEPHYAEQLLTTALETAHGTSLSDAMTIAACERFEDATAARRVAAATRSSTCGARCARRRPGERASSSRRRHHQSHLAAAPPETHRRGRSGRGRTAVMCDDAEAQHERDPASNPAAKRSAPRGRRRRISNKPGSGRRRSPAARRDVRRDRA